MSNQYRSFSFPLHKKAMTFFMQKCDAALSQKLFEFGF